MTPDCEYTIINLTENHEYEFRVMAVNAAGKSDPSSMTMPIKVTETPGKLHLSENFCLLLFIYTKKKCLLHLTYLRRASLMYF